MRGKAIMNFVAIAFYSTLNVHMLASLNNENDA